MDVVTAASTRSCCVTKSYGRYVEGTGSSICTCRILICVDSPIFFTGSILQQADKCDSIEEVRGDEDEDEESKERRVSALRKLRLRFFSPREIARLMGFPEVDKFSFPEETTRLQCYRVLGNSLNVTVVAFLLRILLSHRRE